MVASEGRPFAYRVIVEAMELARPLGADIFVMSIARVWGTSLGFPNPGLLPTKHEWDEQRLLRAPGGVLAGEGRVHRERNGAGHARAAQAHHPGGDAAQGGRDRDGRRPEAAA